MASAMERVNYPTPRLTGHGGVLALTRGEIPGHTENINKVTGPSPFNGSVELSNTNQNTDTIA